VGEQRRPLTLEDREEISRCLALQLTNKEIAVHTERSESVICREIARNGGREKYRAHRAQARAEEERCRPEAAQKPARWMLIRCCAAGWCPACAAACPRIRYPAG
jgi:IS30 family transposase